jgi:hypothetical protein
MALRIKRYDPADQWLDDDTASIGMEEDASGEYVKHEDFVRIVREAFFAGAKWQDTWNTSKPSKQEEVENFLRSVSEEEKPEPSPLIPDLDLSEFEGCSTYNFTVTPAQSVGMPSSASATRVSVHRDEKSEIISGVVNNYATVMQLYGFGPIILSAGCFLRVLGGPIDFHFRYYDKKNDYYVAIFSYVNGAWDKQIYSLNPVGKK